MKYIIVVFLYQICTLFSSDPLPGSANDPRSLPSLPLSTDTNRFADGSSSLAAYDYSAPHFPRYNGPVADSSQLYLHYVNYTLSAAEQGLALSNEGDAEIEAARLKVISMSNYSSLSAPYKIFNVNSFIKWNPSDYAIQKGETYRIHVLNHSTSNNSIATWQDGTITNIAALGYDSYYDSNSNCYKAYGICKPYLKKRRRLVSANWMSLVCGIGDYVRSALLSLSLQY